MRNWRQFVKHQVEATNDDNKTKNFLSVHILLKVHFVKICIKKIKITKGVCIQLFNLYLSEWSQLLVRKPVYVGQVGCDNLTKFCRTSDSTAHLIGYMTTKLNLICSLAQCSILVHLSHRCGFRSSVFCSWPWSWLRYSSRWCMTLTLNYSGSLCVVPAQSVF